MSSLEVQSYVGSDIAQMGSQRERSPRAAELVASIDMGSGPGGGDYRTYLLSTDRERSGWTLWQKGSDYDTGKVLYCRVAYGTPGRGIHPKDAAEELLTKTWQAERDLEGVLPHRILVELAGLLTARTIRYGVGENLYA